MAVVWAVSHVAAGVLMAQSGESATAAFAHGDQPVAARPDLPNDDDPDGHSCRCGDRAPL
ncbi:hypothetical protein ACIPYQ_22750 [Streptomyces sp. NPDC090045]|uniref:hypothetical protein n=1 Tax=Streptomyces sp. NPDC090045 TaxID=3365927 RepID=UPI0038023596